MKNSKYKNCSIYNSNLFLGDFERVVVIADTLISKSCGNIEIRIVNNSLTSTELVVKGKSGELLLSANEYT